jgi:uncharacterized membrane protein
VLQKKSKVSYFLGVKFDFWIVTALFLLFSFLYSTLSVIRHEHFQSQAIDFSVYDQALWLYSQFQPPVSTIFNVHDLADRFRPIMILVSTLYRLTDNERVILVFQSIMLCAAAFPLWLLARKHLPRLLAIVAAFLYLDFIGIQAVNVYDFHEMSMLPVLFAFLFYFLEKGYWKSYFVTLVLCLMVREHVGLLLSMLFVFIFTYLKKPKIAAVTFLISLFWSFLAIKIIMPSLGQKTYASFLHEGDSLENAVWSYIKNPFLIFKNFSFPFVKLSTIFWSFASFGFVGFLFLPLAPLIFFQFSSRFLDMQHPIRWTLYYHYSAELAVALTIATIYSLKNIISRFRKRKLVYFLYAMVIFFHITSNVYLHSPLKNLLKPGFYKNESWMDNNRVILSKIPKGASLASQNNLLPHLSHRNEIYLIPNVNNPEYMVFDLRPAQDNWNFYTYDLDKTKNLFMNLVTSKAYRIVYSAGDAYLLNKNQH